MNFLFLAHSSPQSPWSPSYQMGRLRLRQVKHLCSGRVLALAVGEVLGSMHGCLGAGGDLGAESYSKEVFNVIAEASF